MNDSPRLAPEERMVSLDVFRGITIAGMILVNNPGSRKAVFPPLEHARWNGCTPTDLVFPFFLFIVGVAMTFSLDRRAASAQGRRAVLTQVARRTLLLMLLGLALGAMPDLRLMGRYVAGIVGTALWFAEPRSAAKPWKLAGAVVLAVAAAWFVLDYGHFAETKQRVPGVLQRIAACYFLASMVMLAHGTLGRAVWLAALVLGYWALCRLVHAPEGYRPEVLGPEGLLHAYIDERVLGPHVSGVRPDSLGVLSTPPAVATTLMGALAGTWLKSSRTGSRKALGLLAAGALAILVGLALSHSTPLNKKIWTSSYVLFTGGAAMVSLAVCLWAVDVRGWRRWARPFLVVGTNAIAVFVASSVLSSILIHVKVRATDGSSIMLKAAVFERFFAPLACDARWASLAYAVCYTLLWIVAFVPLYRKRWFIKV